MPQPEWLGGYRESCSENQVEVCNRSDAITLGDEVGSSAAGPKPACGSFTPKLERIRYPYIALAPSAKLQVDYTLYGKVLLTARLYA